jgi:hypothetical protein
MRGMSDFGRFGDERLQKGGPICWPPSWENAAPACVGSAAIARGRSAFGGFCTMSGRRARKCFRPPPSTRRGRRAGAMFWRSRTRRSSISPAMWAASFGVVGNGRDIGFFLHPVIVVDAGSGDPSEVGHCGGILGLADAFVGSRKKAPPGGRKKRERERKKARPIALKESGRWIDGLNAAERVLGGAETVTMVADCESDIYELFAAPRSPHVHLLVRAEHDRCPSGGDKLFAATAACAHVAGWQIDIPAKPGQPARPAQVKVSFQRMEIVRPHYGYPIKRLPAKIALSAVRGDEVDPPEGVKPIVWLLLTTHEANTLDDAKRIVGWYRARWTVEQVFRTTKTQGFDLERKPDRDARGDGQARRRRADRRPADDAIGLRPLRRDRPKADRCDGRGRRAPGGGPHAEARGQDGEIEEPPR